MKQERLPEFTEKLNDLHHEFSDSLEPDSYVAASLSWQEPDGMLTTLTYSTSGLGPDEDDDE